MTFFGIIKQSLQGPNGTYDPLRILFGIGGTNGIITPVVFEIWAMARGQAWDPIAFCTAYGGMLAAVMAAGGLAISAKDRGTAQAEATTSAAATATIRG